MLAAEGSAPRNTLGCNASTRTAIETIGATGTALGVDSLASHSAGRGEKSWRRDGVESGEFVT